MRTWKWVLESAVTSILCWCEQRSSSRRQQGKNIFKTTIGAGGYTHKHTHKHTHTQKNKHTHKNKTHTHKNKNTHTHTHADGLNQIYWLVVSTPLKKIVSWDYSSQLNGKITKTCSKPTTSICIIVQYHIIRKSSPTTNQLGNWMSEVPVLPASQCSVWFGSHWVAPRAACDAKAPVVFEGRPTPWFSTLGDFTGKSWWLNRTWIGFMQLDLVG